MKGEIIDKLMYDTHSQAVSMGWWSKQRSNYTLLQLVITEITEATEGVRKKLMDKHLPDLKNEDVELADALLRLCDFAQASGIVYLPDTKPHYLVKPDAAVQSHLGCVMAVCKLAKLIVAGAPGDIDQDYVFSKAANSIIATAQNAGYDIIKTCYKKLAYNLIREDHKLENQPEF